MPEIKRVCINCGSSIGILTEYVENAKLLGSYFAKNNVEIVYGGAAVGLMGVVADSALQNGGRVIGVIPESINDKVGHKNLTKLYTVKTMHERKNLMFELSDAFIALPGGLGTLEEILEILTWSQLGFHSKPCGFLNVEGYFDIFLKFMDYSVQQRFIKQEHRDMMVVSDKVDSLFEQLRNYKKENTEKWVGGI